MRRDEAQPSLVQRLFAERHIYLRSGRESRYVVVSSTLQAGVSLIALLVLIILGGALYSSVDKHLEAAEQERKVARLEGVNKSLLAAAEATRDDGAEAAARPQAELMARLDQAEAARARAEDLAEAASAERDEFRRELDLARSRVDEAVTQLAAVQAERDALMSQLNAQTAPAAGADADSDPSALRAELADLTVERAALEAELDRVREEARENVAQLDAAERDMAALRSRLEQNEARYDQVEQLEVRIATLQAENEQLTQAVDEIQGERHELQSRLQEVEAGDARPGDEPAADEVARLRDQLAEAEARLAEMEQALYQVEPGAGPADADDGAAETQRLRSELEAARTRIAALERAADTSPAGLQRRPAVGDSVLASDFAQGENGVPEVAPAPAYQNALEAVMALRAELAAVDQLVGVVAGSEDRASEDSIQDLKTQIDSAAGRIQSLNATLDRLRERDVALQRALVTLAPLPPPPAPR